MTRNLKALGLAVFVVFALSAVAASAASAANDSFKSNSANEKTDLTGTTEAGVIPTLTAAGFTVECEKGTYAGTVAGNSVPSVTVHPTYDGFATKHEGKCYLPALEATVTVTTHGCDYKLTGETNVSGDAAVYIVCTSGKRIELDVPSFGITLDINEQGPLYGVSYTNKNTAETGSGKETVTVKATVSGIKYSCTGALCFLLPGGGAGENAAYNDQVMVTGYEDSGTFAADSNHTWSGTHGSQKHIWVE